MKGAGAPFPWITRPLPDRHTHAIDPSIHPSDCQSRIPFPFLRTRTYPLRANAFENRNQHRLQPAGQRPLADNFVASSRDPVVTRSRSASWSLQLQGHPSFLQHHFMRGTSDILLSIICKRLSSSIFCPERDEHRGVQPFIKGYSFIQIKSHAYQSMSQNIISCFPHNKLTTFDKLEHLQREPPYPLQTPGRAARSLSGPKNATQPTSP